jgi:hypothetical protein
VIRTVQRLLADQKRVPGGPLIRESQVGIWNEVGLLGGDARPQRATKKTLHADDNRLPEAP